MRTNQASNSTDLHQLERRLEGIRSETTIAERLESILDDRFVLIRNSKLPGQWGDIDQIIIGPSGVLVIEIKDYIGRFRAERDEWTRVTNDSGPRDDINPIRQALNNVERLRQFLARNGINSSHEIVQARIILANDRTVVEMDRPAVYIIFSNRVEQEIGNWSRSGDSVLSPDSVNRIAELLGYSIPKPSATETVSKSNPIGAQTPSPLSPSRFQSSTASSSFKPYSNRSRSYPKRKRRPISFLIEVLFDLVILFGVLMLFLSVSQPQWASSLFVQQTREDSGSTSTILGDINVKLDLLSAEFTDSYLTPGGKSVVAISGNQYVWLDVAAEALTQSERATFPAVTEFSLLRAGQEYKPWSYPQDGRAGCTPYRGGRIMKPGEKEEGCMVFMLPKSPNGGLVSLQLKVSPTLFSIKTYSWTIAQ
jgi:hypothetical protein